MNVAFHFDSHAPEYGMFYGYKVIDKFLTALVRLGDEHIHVKIFLGDLLIFPKYGQNPENYAKLVNSLTSVEERGWSGIDVDRFVHSLRSTILFVVAVEGLSREQRDALHNSFLKDKTYLGCIIIRETDEVHWDLYGSALIPKYRYLDGSLRVFHSGPTENERDVSLMEIFQKLPLKSVTWENIEQRYTIFDNYDSFEHSKRVGELKEMLGEKVSSVIDDVLFMLGDLNPSLQNELSSAMRALNNVQVEEDVAHTAISCRRFLTGLADVLYPPTNKIIEGRKLGIKQYRNRLWMFIKENSKDHDRILLAQIDDLGSRVDLLDKISNKGVHARISTGVASRLLIDLVLTTHDILSLYRPAESGSFYE